MSPRTGRAASFFDIETFLLRSQLQTFLRHFVAYAVSLIKRDYNLFATVQV